MSVVEVLGIHKLTAEEKRQFEAFFAASEVLPINAGVISKAVSLRQSRKMSLGDSLVAATAMEFGRELFNATSRTSQPSPVWSSPIHSPTAILCDSWC